jgi:hypothetical protein
LVDDLTESIRASLCSPRVRAVLAELEVWKQSQELQVEEPVEKASIQKVGGVICGE